MMGGRAPEKCEEGQKTGSCKERESRETQSVKQSGGMREASMHCSPFGCSDMMEQRTIGNKKG